jgi:hypothetical protein
MGLRRVNDERGEDLLEDPVSDSVEFTSLAPLTNSGQAGRLFSVLSDPLIKRHCDPFLYERADTILNNTGVVLVSVGNERITGKVCDRDVFSVEIWFEHGGLSGSCQCEGCRRHTETSTSGDQRLACAHIVALARFVVKSNLIPQLSPGESADLCPITRLPLDASRVIFRCQRCQLSFSEEGWQFLKEMDRGRCCGCQGRNCICALTLDSKEPHGGAIT